MKIIVLRIVFSNAEDNSSGLLNRGSIAHLPLLRTLLENTIIKVATAKFLESYELFYFSSICEFGSFKNPSAMLLTCLNFTLDSEDLFNRYKRKK